MSRITEQALLTRTKGYDLNSLFPGRWSPRAMNGKRVTQEELNMLLEAARWAPSSFNEQPWKFLYAHRDTPFWDVYFSLLGEFNQSWCKDAAVLIVVLSKDFFDHNNKPNKTSSFDAGSAWQNLALQGAYMGLVTHAMAGFDYDKAREVLAVPEGYAVEAMIAVGKPDSKERLPAELAEKEFPSERKPLNEIAFEGKFS
jgi:nitroreductase